MLKRNENTKFKIVRKGYDAKEVDSFLLKTEKEQAAAIASQKKIIDELSEKLEKQRLKIEEYESKSKRISDALMNAVAKADEIEKLSAFKYTQEMEQLKTFHARWLTYYAKLIKKYPLTEDLEAVRSFNDKVNRILGDSDKDESASVRFREEFSKLIKQNGALDEDGDDDIPSFAPATFMKLPDEGKNESCATVKQNSIPDAADNSGFSFEEALNPKQSLEEIMADLGLLMDGTDNL